MSYFKYLLVISKYVLIIISGTKKKNRQRRKSKIVLNMSSVSKSIVGVIGETINISGNVNISTNQSKKQQKIDEFGLPPLIATFQGRDNELKILETLFFEQKCKRVVLCGFPGFGKTETAKQFVNQSKINAKVDKIFWMNAETNKILIQSFEALAKFCDIFLDLDEKNLVKNVYEHFNDYKCLFIFDNAVCRKDITGFEPQEHLLLVTSREKDWGDDFESLELDILSPESALTVLKSILCDKYNENDRNLYEKLGFMVSNVPLGLQIIGGYVRHHKQCLGDDFNLKNYVETLKISQEKVMEIKIPSSIPNTYQKSIYGAVKVSLDRMINEEDEELKENALELLCVCSLLNPDDYYFFEAINKILQLPKVELKLAIALIANLSFVFFRNCKSMYNIRIHRLTQFILKFHFSTANNEILTKSYAKCLRYIMDDDYCDIRNKWSHFIPILRHADEYTTLTYNFYEKYSPEVYPVNGVYNVFKNILLRLVAHGCAISLSRIFKDISPKYINKYDLLHKAAENKHVNVLKVLLCYADVDSTDSDGNTTMHTAARMWHIPTIKLLIENNANINSKNKYGDTPLFHFFYGACFTETLYEVHPILSLLRFQANKHVTNNKNETLLHAAAFSCREDLVTLLVKKYKFEINKVDISGNTPLHTCIFYLVLNPDIKNILSTLNAFIENGASVTYRNKNNLTPLEMLLERKKSYKFNYQELVFYLNNFEDLK